MSSIQPAAIGASHRVHAAIRDASTRTDTDFNYLLAQARIESSLDPSAKASTSSAAGLYQFTRQTWLETLHRHGDEHGLGWASNAISMEGGRARISDPALESAIMQMRYDPQTSSLMAAELAGDNGNFLQGHFGRPADHTELYLAHFLGAEGARTFISAHESNPDQSAASLFPSAARANRGVFFEGGRARSVGEVRDLFASKIETLGSETPMGATILANAGVVGSSAAGSSSYGSSSFSAPGFAPAPAPNAPSPARRASMSDILESTFGPADRGSGAASAHVSRAYKTIARFGL